MVVDAVLREWRRRDAEQSLRVRLVVAEEEVGIAFELEDVPTQLVVFGDDVPGLDRDRRLAGVDPHAQVLRNHRVGSTSIVAGSGPAFVSVTFTYTSSVVAFANSASIAQ